MTFYNAWEIGIIVVATVVGGTVGVAAATVARLQGAWGLGVAMGVAGVASAAVLLTANATGL